MNYQPEEVARVKWALEASRGGSTPLQRIYSTLRKLGSTLTHAQVEELVQQQVTAGVVAKSPHPFNEGEFFYSLAEE